MVLELLYTKASHYSNSISIDCSTPSTSITTTTTTTKTTTATSNVVGVKDKLNRGEEEEEEDKKNVEVGGVHLHRSSRGRVDRRVKPTTSSTELHYYHPREDTWTKGSIVRRRVNSMNSYWGVEKRLSSNIDDGLERNSSRTRTRYHREFGGEEGVVVVVVNNNNNVPSFIDKVESFHLNDGGDQNNKLVTRSRTHRRGCCSNGEIKKLGETISEGHRKYQLVQGLQLGIRFSVGRSNSISREISPEDFDPKEKFWTRFPPRGSKTTPAHSLMEFRWKDYCPMVFRQLRELLEVDSADYKLAICENGSLRELSSPGKSGSFFYLTQDDRFMIKTLKKSEVKVLLRMLPGYYNHFYQYRNSLITKFFGVHCIKPIGGLKTRFIVMGNLFSSEYRIHRRFDLKGSSHGRMTSKPGEGVDENTTLKDLDLNFIFQLKQYWLQKLNRQIARDCKFLESERIMDYSLLVGLHFLECSGNSRRLSSNVVPSGNKNLLQEEVNSCKCHFVGMERRDVKGILSCRKSLIRLGANMPAKAQHVARNASDKLTPSEGGNSTPNGGEICRVILHFGIIDILQDYDINKKLEHVYKSLQVDPGSISAVDPKLYSSRFRDFIHKIFVEDKKSERKTDNVSKILKDTH
ncbi:hypothetical protein Scep_002845 [Stephania cephalantha]|uniref:1-phosphatidylinositol-4-phosphate 5-kinase n=1 Tax=Stephania cephalantha TaxID=152367 RepID=A0AAP0LEP6_9MAGN